MLRFLFSAMDALCEETSARQVALGCLVGMWLGLIPLGTLQGLVLAGGLIALRANLICAAGSFVFFGTLSLVGERVLHALGWRVLTHFEVLNHFWAWAYHAPVLPLTHFNNTVVMGAMVVAALISVPLYILVRQIAQRKGEAIGERFRFAIGWSRFRNFSLYRRYRGGSGSASRRWTLLRREAVPFLGALLLGLVIFCEFFLDERLKGAAEGFVAKHYRMRLEMSSFTLHFWKGTVEIDGLALASPNQPQENLIQVDRLFVAFQPKLLLRKKLFIDEIKVEGIQYRVPRTVPVAVPDLQSADGVASLFDRTSDSFFPQLAEQGAKNPLRHLSRLSGNVDWRDTLGRFSDGLYSTRKLEQLRLYLQQKKEQWKEEELRAPASVETRRAWKEDLERTRLATVGIDSLLDHDTAMLLDRLEVPPLDQRDFTRPIFGARVLSYLERIAYWVELSRERMPLGSRHGEVTWSAQLRPRGMSIHYGKTGGFPALLVQHISLESELAAGTRRGRVKGEISGLNSDPSIYGNPTVFFLEADFPENGVTGVHLQGLIDHVHGKYFESFQFGADSMQVQNWNLVETGELSLGVRHGQGSMRAEGRFTDTALQLASELVLQDVEYGARSPLASVNDAVEGIVRPAKSLRLSTMTEGPFADASLAMRSDFGLLFAAGLQHEYRKNYVGLKEQIHRLLEESIATPRERLLSEVAQSQEHLNHP